MFTNVGKKIKILAVLLFALETIGSIIGAIALFAEGRDEEIIMGVILLFAGPLIALIGAWFLFGFGEIIDKLTDIERNTRGDITKSTTQSNIDYERIATLERLRAQGLISEEEYQAAVAKA